MLTKEQTIGPAPLENRSRAFLDKKIISVSDMKYERKMRIAAYHFK